MPESTAYAIAFFKEAIHRQIDAFGTDSYLLDLFERTIEPRLPADNDDSVKLLPRPLSLTELRDHLRAHHDTDIHHNDWDELSALHADLHHTASNTHSHDEPTTSAPKSPPTLAQGDAVIINGCTYKLDSIGTFRAELRRSDLRAPARARDTEEST